jgi:hypothetical protein
MEQNTRCITYMGTVVTGSASSVLVEQSVNLIMITHKQEGRTNLTSGWSKMAFSLLVTAAVNCIAPNCSTVGVVGDARRIDSAIENSTVQRCNAWIKSLQKQVLT